MNNLTSIEPERELPTKLDIAKQALADATENWQRVQIRDTARAVEAAAAILKRKDIQIQAANLVQEAERAIAKASPPQQGKRTDRKNFVIQNHEVPPDVPYITPQDVRQMRYAHNNLTDAEFNAAQQEAIETETPLTRSALQKRAKAKKQADNRAKRDTLLTVQAKPLSTGGAKYHIIYADPPWRYNFVASENRAIENQYPTMELDAIKALPIPRIAAVDAVLYLWATAPKFKEALEVMEAWALPIKPTLFGLKTTSAWATGGAISMNCSLSAHMVIFRHLNLHFAYQVSLKHQKPDTVKSRRLLLKPLRKCFRHEQKLNYFLENLAKDGRYGEMRLLIKRFNMTNNLRDTMQQCNPLLKSTVVAISYILWFPLNFSPHAGYNSLVVYRIRGRSFRLRVLGGHHNIQFTTHPYEISAIYR